MVFSEHRSLSEKYLVKSMRSVCWRYLGADFVSDLTESKKDFGRCSNSVRCFGILSKGTFLRICFLQGDYYSCKARPVEEIASD